MKTGLLFLPDEWLPVIIVGLGLALILGIVRAGWAFSFLAILLGTTLLSPFIDSLMNSLPTRWLILIVLIVGFYLFRVLLNLVLGKEGAGSFMGHLAYDLFSLPFKALAGMIRLFLHRRIR
jgi:hypothetical protein